MPQTFLFGFLGSVSQEIVQVLAAYERNARRLPLMYRKPGYWIVRFLLALMGGGLAVVLDASGPWNAMYIGASAKYILSGLGSRSQRELGEGEQSGGFDVPAQPQDGPPKPRTNQQSAASLLPQ